MVATVVVAGVVLVALIILMTVFTVAQRRPLPRSGMTTTGDGTTMWSDGASDSGCDSGSDGGGGCDDGGGGGGD